jgi:tetratricopeptide (TPR) repeat protein
MQSRTVATSEKNSSWVQDILNRTAFVLFAVLALSLFAHTIIDTDIWWHLSAGRDILQNGKIPAIDPFSYTAGGNEWIDLHWLFQVLVYGVYQTFGSYSLSLLFIATYAATFLISWLTCRRAAPPLLVLLFLWLALMAAGSRFLARPEAFTYLMIALYVLIFVRHDRGQIGRGIFLLIPLQVLWTNLQGLFILGPCLVFAYAAEALFLSFLKDRDKPRRLSLLFSGKTARLLLLFPATLVASLVNPYGQKGLLFPIILFTRAGGVENIFAGSIAELQPPFSGYNLTTPLVFFGIFIVASLLALALDWRNARLSHIIVFLGMGYLGLNARRNVPVFIFAALPLAVEHSGNILTRWREKTGRDPVLQRIKNRASPYVFIIYAAVLAVLTLQAFRVWNNEYYISDRRAERFGLGFKEHNYPEAAFQFIKDVGARGPMFNSLDIGGMFMWELFPSEKVFIDPRLEVNSETTFAAYCGAFSNQESFGSLAQKYGFNTAIISHTSQDGLYLLPAIYRTPGWFLVYLDPVAAVFVRGTPENADIIAKHQIDPARGPFSTGVAVETVNEQNPRAMKQIAKWLSSHSSFDAEAQSRFTFGLALLMLGENEQAAEQLQAGLELRPNSPEAYYNLGLAFDRMGRQETALHCYKQTVELNGRHSMAHANLGRIFDERGLKDEAEREYKLSLRWDGDQLVPLYNLGALYLERGRYDDAKRCWKHALKVNPSFKPARDALERLNREL